MFFGKTSQGQRSWDERETFVNTNSKLVSIRTFCSGISEVLWSALGAKRPGIEALPKLITSGMIDEQIIALKKRKIGFLLRSC